MRWRRWTTSRRCPRTSTSTPRRWRRRRRDVRVLGVDPGTSVTGYGVIETGNGAPTMGRLIECGVISFARRSPLPHRLHQLHLHIADLIARHQPTALALENAFYHKNVQTTLVLGHACGGMLLAAALAGFAESRRGRLRGRGSSARGSAGRRAGGPCHIALSARHREED